MCKMTSTKLLFLVKTRAGTVAPPNEPQMARWADQAQHEVVKADPGRVPRGSLMRVKAELKRIEGMR